MMKKSYPRKFLELGIITAMHVFVLAVWFIVELNAPSCIDCVRGWNINTLPNFQYIFVTLVLIFAFSIIIYSVALYHRGTNAALFAVCFSSSLIFAIIEMIYARFVT